MSNTEISAQKEKELKEEPFGVFDAALRRPKTQKDGLVALFFGENGPESDMISTLHLTRYQEILIKVKVWRKQDENGASQRGIGLDGKPMDDPKKFPLLTTFIARSKRPQPSAYGQTAQFFGKNGRHADAIALLAKSSYQDNLVHVELYSHEENSEFVDITDDDPFAPIEISNEPKTKIEKERAKISGEKDKAFFDKLLTSNFLIQSGVIKHLGSPKGFKAWLSYQTCAYPYTTKENIDNGKVVAFELKQYINVSTVPAEYLYIPICEKHHDELKAIFENDNDEKTEHLRRFAIVEAKRQLELFAKTRLFEQMDVPANHIPRRDAIEAWAVEKDVLHLI